jgi:sigma-B regulation protein RsbU (phosphoserine phosphatase)
MSGELKDARSIQSNLFPKGPPEIPGFSITGICLPCLEVGGDWYDFIPFPDGRLGIVLADVSGKGMGAALLMSSTRSLLRLVANSNLSPKEVLTKLNEILLKDFPSTRFVTMIYAVLDPKEQTLVFSNAGHLNPLFINSSGINFLETTEGLPLGISESTFSEIEVKFSPGSRIVFYSDGVTEAMNSISEEYGSERLIKHFKKPSASVKSIVDDVYIFTNGQQQFDDVTVVVIEAQ